MSARGFRSVVMVGGVAVAALSCYLVSLNVASERAALERVESRIVLTQREVRVLQTEIGTRGRLAQLERWNASVIRLSAPTADQFAADGFQLASLARPEARPAIDAPVVYAAARQDQAPRPAITTDDAATAPPPARSAGDLMHVASYARPARPSAPSTGVAKPATNSAKTAMSDPLAPLPGAKPAGKAPVVRPTVKAAAKPTGAKPATPATKETGTP